MEAITCFFLMYVVMASLWDNRVTQNVYGFVIAGYYAGINLCFSRVYGGSMNPARVIGPAIFSGNILSLWIYLVGPVIGCCLGSLFYRSVHLEGNKRLAEASSQANLIILKPVDLEVF